MGAILEIPAYIYFEEIPVGMNTAAIIHNHIFFFNAYSVKIFSNLLNNKHDTKYFTRNVTDVMSDSYLIRAYKHTQSQSHISIGTYYHYYLGTYMHSHRIFELWNVCRKL